MKDFGASKPNSREYLSGGVPKQSMSNFFNLKDVDEGMQPLGSSQLDGPQFRCQDAANLRCVFHFVRNTIIIFSPLKALA